VNGLTITLVGDLKHGRTVHSLVRLLSLYNTRLIYVSPPSLRMPIEITDEIARSGLVTQEEYDQLEDVIGISDVLYMTRIQKERFDSEQSYQKVYGTYCVTPSLLMKAKSSMIVMHPLPRVNEIDPAVDFDQRAAYFRQMRYGLHIRMALLSLIFGKL
jgi:carbamoyl-phosphate synthase/aspartate carbamoyltransferase